MLDKKVYEDSQLIIRGVSIPLSSGGNGDLKTFLKKVLEGYKWYLGSGDTLYVERESSDEVVNLLKGGGYFRDN